MAATGRFTSCLQRRLRHGYTQGRAGLGSGVDITHSIEFSILSASKRLRGVLRTTQTNLRIGNLHSSPSIRDDAWPASIVSSEPIHCAVMCRDALRGGSLTIHVAVHAPVKCVTENTRNRTPDVAPNCESRLVGPLVIAKDKFEHTTAMGP